MDRAVQRDLVDARTARAHGETIQVAHVKVIVVEKQRRRDDVALAVGNIDQPANVAARRDFI